MATTGHSAPSFRGLTRKWQKLFLNSSSNIDDQSDEEYFSAYTSLKSSRTFPIDSIGIFDENSAKNDLYTSGCSLNTNDYSSGIHSGFNTISLEDMDESSVFEISREKLMFTSTSRKIPKSKKSFADEVLTSQSLNALGTLFMSELDDEKTQQN